MHTLKYCEKSRRATWLELFFDLVLVACMGTLTHHLGEVANHGLSAWFVVEFLGEFVPVWWLWASHTYYCNRFDTDSKPHRLVTLVMAFLLASMAAYLGSESHHAHIWFVGIYALTRCLQAGLYLTAREKHGSNHAYAKTMGAMIGAGALVSSLSVFAGSEAGYYGALFLGVFMEMALTAWVTRHRISIPIHLPHLVERVGLLSLILLGESVISLAAGLRGIAWNRFHVLAAITGFTMICAIWWIYFDSFPFLERAKRIKHGFVLLYSHLVFCLGLVVLANLIRYAIRSEIEMREFQILAITGMTLFYLGKQFPYFVAFPVYRVNNVVNSTLCIGITVLSTFFTRPEYALLGMTAGMIFYVYSNMTWTLTKDAHQYLSPEN